MEMIPWNRRERPSMLMKTWGDKTIKRGINRNKDNRGRTEQTERMDLKQIKIRKKRKELKIRNLTDKNTKP